MKTKSAKALFLAISAALAFGVQAESFPVKPISMVVPFPPGGAADAVARILADDLSERLGQQVIVENQNGAGGTIGSSRVARAKPDGYTLLLNNMSQSTVNVFNEKLSYDALKDFSSIGSVAYIPMMLVSNRNFPAKDAAAAIKYLKENSDKISIANNGSGSVTHLCGTLIQRAIGVSGLIEVPYKGSGPALVDVIGGQVDLTCDSSASTNAYLESGKLTALAMTSRERVPTLPDVPTFKELGYESFDLSLWFALYAPQRTPDAIVEKISGALQEAVVDAKFDKRITALGATPEKPADATPLALDKRMQSETQRWRQLFKN